MLSWCSCSIFVLIVILYKLFDYLIRLPKRRNLDQNYVLITGCDSGFGYEAAKRFDALGCHVIAGCLTETGETELRKTCSSRLFTVPLDVSKHESVAKAYDLVVQHLPQGKGLVGVLNNAGIGGTAGGLADWLVIQDYVDVMRVNLLGVIDVTTTFLPLLKKERGRIVNTASVAGRIAGSFSGPYSVSKYGVEAFSDVIRRELRPFGISVHIIEPGSFKTNITKPERFIASAKTAWNRMPEEKRREYGDDYIKFVYDAFSNEAYQKILNERIDLVVDAYQHALFGFFPRARYLVGWDAKYVFIPLQWLPEWLSDWLLDHIMKLPTPAACKH